MTATETTTEKVEATAERVRELNEQIIEASKKAGVAYLDTYEKALTRLAEFEEKAADASQVEWFSALLTAQADFTRDMAKLYTSAGRDFLK